MTQLSLLASDFGNALTIRTHHRREDGDTSREAARKVVAHLTESQERALTIIACYGPGTLQEIAYRKCANAGGPFNGQDMTKLYHELERRAPELERDLKVRTTGAKNGRSRVWEAC